MKKILLILVLLVGTSFEPVKQKTDYNYTLISEVKLFMRQDGQIIVIYDGIVSPCFTREYFDAYYPCSKFKMDKYMEELKKQLQQEQQQQQRKTYRI